MFANIPKHIISAVGPAYLTRPDVTIASLFGTTPCTLNAKLNNVPKSFPMIYLQNADNTNPQLFNCSLHIFKLVSSVNISNQCHQIIPNESC